MGDGSLIIKLVRRTHKIKDADLPHGYATRLPGEC